jgi:hypothetical protein
MSSLKKLVKENKPFAVMQYFQSVKVIYENQCKIYELIELINGGVDIRFKTLNRADITYLKENLDIIKVVINNSDGKIYEFNNFKKYYQDFKNLHGIQNSFKRLKI